MPAFTTRYGMYKPGGGSTGLIVPDEVADVDKFNDNFDKIDAALGAVGGLSTARPSTPADGQLFYETDTGGLVRFNQALSQWVYITPGVDFQTYVPQFTASSTNPALGTSPSVLGWYMRQGNKVDWQASITFGSSGATAGSGNYHITLPFPPSTAYNVPSGPGIVGQGLITKSGDGIAASNAANGIVPVRWDGIFFATLSGSVITSGNYPVGNSSHVLAWGTYWCAP